MPVFKDEERGTYYVKVYFTDWKGERRQKMKRGFKLQREAKKWETDFLKQQAGTPDMTFAALWELYIDDCSKRNKQNTIRGKRSVYNVHLAPYWKDMPLNQITPAAVRKWQGNIITSGIGAAQQRRVNVLFSSVLNYAVKYYGLLHNPCHTTGHIGKSNVRRLQFWTNDQFRDFIAGVDDEPLRLSLQILFYAGLRCGELLALTPADIDLAAGIININKTYHRYGRQDVITSPKTDNSNRSVVMPEFLTDAIREHLSHLYGIGEDDRIFFSITPYKLNRAIKDGIQTTNIPPITVHGLRHSHVSLLIEMGFTPHLIADRIGDTTEMVNQVYGHLYPNKQSEVAKKLQLLVSK